jgi:hypothetical protein
MLSRPPSLQSPSDIPPPVVCLLPVSSDLKQAYRRRRTAGSVGLQVQGSVLCLRMPMALPRVPDRCVRPLPSLSALAFPKTGVGRRVARFLHRFLGFIPFPDSLGNNRPGLSDKAAPFTLCYGLRIWRGPRAEYDVRHLQRSPSRHHVGASSAALLPERLTPILHTQKGQLVWQSPSRLLDYGLETSYTVVISGGDANLRVQLNYS